jgi:hypothetical protein
MKNCLTQAMAAIIYADKHYKTLYLHINTERVEQKGENSLKNVRDLFKGTKHKLVEHNWLKHSDFVKLVSTMDLGLQVSLTETYNIVSADFINQLVPVVTSKEVPFVNKLSIVNQTNNTLEIVNVIEKSFREIEFVTNINKLLLEKNSKDSKDQWLNIFKKK